MGGRARQSQDSTGLFLPFLGAHCRWHYLCRTWRRRRRKDWKGTKQGSWTWLWASAAVKKKRYTFENVATECCKKKGGGEGILLRPNLCSVPVWLKSSSEILYVQECLECQSTLLQATTNHHCRPRCATSYCVHFTTTTAHSTYGSQECCYCCCMVALF